MIFPSNISVITASCACVSRAAFKDDRGRLANHLRYDRVVRLEFTYDRSNKLLRREYPNGKIAFSIRKLRLCCGFDGSCHATN